jgi:hypothetical protein
MSLAEDPEVKRIGLFGVVAILQNNNVKTSDKFFEQHTKSHITV